jgi:hypothetical protein
MLAESVPPFYILVLVCVGLLCEIFSEFLEGLDNAMTEPRVLFIMCERGNKAQSQTLLQCAQYRVQKLWTNQVKNRHVIFIVQLPRVTNEPFTGYIVRHILFSHDFIDFLLLYSSISSPRYNACWIFSDVWCRDCMDVHVIYMCIVSKPIHGTVICTAEHVHVFKPLSSTRYCAVAVGLELKNKL